MQAKSQTADEKPILLFRQKNAWAAWLEKNQSTSSGVWLRFAKKASGRKSVSYDEALDVALCYGWIDGQKRPEDEEFWLQAFTPRRKRSIWSKRNREKALALIDSGEMQQAGWRRPAMWPMRNHTDKVLRRVSGVDRKRERKFFSCVYHCRWRHANDE